MGRTAAHRRAMLRNMVCNLMVVDTEGGKPRRITTTVPKAKEARRLAERLITLGKRGTLHARRRALTLLQDKAVVKLLFEEIAPLYNDRNGGYTRILRIPKWRRGDGADLCYFELVSEAVEAAPKPEEPVAPKVTTSEEPETPPTGGPEQTEEPAGADQPTDDATEDHEPDEGDETPAS